MPMITPDTFILYDGECPVCSRYVALTRLRSLRPDIAVLDARRNPAIVAELRSQGYDVNEGVIVKLGSRIHIGAAATRLLSDLSSQNPIVRRWAVYALIGGPWSESVYPALRTCRNGLLRLLGRGQIG